MSVTAKATWLDDEQLAAWLAALNDLRLALGSMLGVTEDEIEPPMGDAPSGRVDRIPLPGRPPK